LSSESAAFPPDILSTCCLLYRSKGYFKFNEESNLFLNNYIKVFVFSDENAPKAYFPYY
jgi:hypothetical protein